MISADCGDPVFGGGRTACDCPHLRSGTAGAAVWFFPPFPPPEPEGGHSAAFSVRPVLPAERGRKKFPENGFPSRRKNSRRAENDQIGKILLTADDFSVFMLLERTRKANIRNEGTIWRKGLIPCLPKKINWPSRRSAPCRSMPSRKRIQATPACRWEARRWPIAYGPVS